MTIERIPQTDSIEELARFWDTHDVTDFEDELEEVPQPVFVKDRTVHLHFDADEAEQLERIAKSQGADAAELIRGWVLERLQQTTST